MKVLRGEIEFEKQEEGSESKNKFTPQSKVLHESESLGFHRFSNTAEGETVTVHIYNPPFLQSCFTQEPHKVGHVPPLVYTPIDTSKCFSEKILLADLDVRDSLLYTNLTTFSAMLDKQLQDYSVPLESQHVGKFRDWISNLRFNKCEWSKFLNIDKDKYTRNLVSYGERFTLLILCWNKGQKSPIHSHSGSNCFMKSNNF